MVPDKELDEAIQAFAGGNTPGTRNVHALLLELKGRRDSELRPAVKFLGAGLEKQLEAIREEVDEVADSVAIYLANKELGVDSEFDKIHLSEELVDVQTACETMMEMAEIYADRRQRVRRMVAGKNTDRGYYEVTSCE
jgi:NTP pyrophosphatase (non-canonical NTP hydrolase)